MMLLATPSGNRRRRAPIIERGPEPEAVIVPESELEAMAKAGVTMKYDTICQVHGKSDFGLIASAFGRRGRVWRQANCVP